MPGSGIPYRAAGDTRPSAVRDGNTLRTKATKLDRILAVFNVWEMGGDITSIFREWCQFLPSQLDHFGHVDLTANSRASARSLIGNVATSSSQYPAPEEEYFAHFAACLCNSFAPTDATDGTDHHVY